MENQQTTNYTMVTPAPLVHALLLQWLLNPQSSNFTRGTIQAINWDRLFQYYQEDEHEDKFQVLIDYLCQIDYRQLRNHTLVPLIQHQLLPRIFAHVISTAQIDSINPHSMKTPIHAAKQSLKQLQQLLNEQEELIKLYFYHSPKALVNVLSAIADIKCTRPDLQDVSNSLPKLYDLAFVAYLQLPNKPAYRFAALEIRSQLLAWFPELHVMVNHFPTEALAKLTFVRHFTTLEGRQMLQNMIQHRQIQSLPQVLSEVESHFGLPLDIDEQPYISRKNSGLVRSW